MPRGLLLAIVLVTPCHPVVPAARVLGAGIEAGAKATNETEPRVTLELRLFNGVEEVTAHTRVSVHRAGERGEPIAQRPSGTLQLEIDLPAGLYDVQAIRERDGRALNIRWAQRLVVMPYPDERGRHLEVINFQNGFGALQVSTHDRAQPQVSVYKAGEHQGEPAPPVAGPGYVLFILPAGAYDILITAAKTTTWQNGIEVPLDRTRLWIVP